MEKVEVYKYLTLKKAMEISECVSNPEYGFVFVLSCKKGIRIGHTHHLYPKLYNVKDKTGKRRKKGLGPIAITSAHANYMENDRIIRAKIKDKKIGMAKVYDITFDEAISLLNDLTLEEGASSSSSSSEINDNKQEDINNSNKENTMETKEKEMNGSIQIFKSAEFGELRAMWIDDEPWFVGRDVAVALGYVKPENAISTHVDEEDKTTTLIQGNGSNYKSKTTIINESGFYSLVLSSQLPSSKKFNRWVWL